LVLGATGAQLLLDGVPQKAHPQKNNLHSCCPLPASLASSFSLHYPGRNWQVRPCIPTGKAKPTELATQLKAALVGAQGIRLNEVCFVATDSRLKDAHRGRATRGSVTGEDHDEFRSGSMIHRNCSS
jgi:hypothetical protein